MLQFTHIYNLIFAKLFIRIGMKIKNYRIDDFTLDVGKRELAYKDQPIRLSSRAFDILLYLLKNKGTVVKKDELLDEVWTDSFVEEANLAVHISAIRRVLKEKKGECKYIKTISGRGYSFVSPVKEIEANPEVNKTKESDLFSQVEEDVDISLAVLPIIFEEKGNENEYLANGITQSLISDLSQIPNLRVLSYSAVKSYKNSELELQEIGFLLDADKLFTGHIYEYDNKLAIGVELINAKDKSCVWGNEYLFEKDDIFKVKKEISQVIADKLKLKLSTQKLKQEIDAEAQKLYYRGKFILEARTTKKEPKEFLVSALDYFKKAVAIEPNYALAQVGVGTVYVSLHNLNLAGQETYEEARKALNNALKIDNELSEAYVLKGSIEVMFEDKLKEAKNSFDKAIKLNANNPDAYHWKGLACMFLGEYDEAYKLETIATQLDPTSIRFNEGLMRIFFYSENFEKSIIQAEEILEFDKNNSASYLFIALNYAHLNLFDLALENIDICIRLRKNEEHLLTKAYIYAMKNDRKRSIDIVHQIIGTSNSANIDSRDIAAVYSALNEMDTAIEYLFKAKKENRNLTRIKINIRFKNLLNYKKFHELLKNR